MRRASRFPSLPGRTTLAGLVRRRPALAALVLTALVSAPFVAVPDIDLAASAAFHDPVEGFVGRKAWFAEAIRTVARLIEALALSAFLGPLAVKLVWPESRLLVRPRAALFAAATLLLGPGLLVNAILKGHWGRARPHTVEAFGGEAAFTRAWEMSDACERNCSFVGGEAASAVWLVAVALLAPAPWRGRLIALALAVTAAVSLARLAAGGHFLSDILIGACLTLLVIAALYRPIMRRLPPAFDARVEAWLARAGRRLRRLVPDRSRAGGQGCRRSLRGRTPPL